MSRSSTLLRLALVFNLVFSAACAAALLLSGPAIGQVIGGFADWIMMALGIGLAGFALLLCYALARLRIGLALIISVLDLLWIAGTLPLLAIPDLLTTQGAYIVLVVASAVGLAAALQLRGIYTMLRVENRNEYRHCVVLETSTTADDLWAVVRDLGSISRYSDGLKSSRMEGESDDEYSPGAVRVCTSTKDQSWSEELTSLDEETRSLVLRFRSEAEDFPFPFATMIGGWTIEPRRDGGSNVEIWWQVRPLHSRFGWLLLAMATISLDPQIRRIVAAMEGGPGNSSRHNALLPPLAYC